MHNIRLVRQSEARNALATLTSISFTGYFEDAPKNAEHYIEYYGASICCGYGNLAATGTTATEAQKSLNTDATQAFPYLTASKLGADYSVVSASGLGLVRGYRPFNGPQLFENNSIYRSTTLKYQPARTPDVIVLSFGGNDQGKSVTIQEWTTAATNFIKQIRQTYGKDVPIVWVYMTTNNYFPEVTKGVNDALGGEAAGLYVCKLTQNKDGGNNHPSLAGHITAAEELVAFMQQKNLLK